MFFGIKAFGNSLDSVKILFDVKVPMRDGVELSAWVYIPNYIKEPQPAVLRITPYLIDRQHDLGMDFAKNGFVHVVVDCRGRGNSDGKFKPFGDQGKDGVDIINWISKQDWCDGNVGMIGGSIEGAYLWQTIKEFPTALKTAVPIASVGPGIDFPICKNILDHYFIAWYASTMGKIRNKKLSEYWGHRIKAMHKKGRSILEEIEGSMVADSLLFEVLNQKEFNDYWKKLYPSKLDYENIDIPILTITGYYDADQLGALFYYDHHIKYAKNKNHYLVIGPWNHKGTVKPKEHEIKEYKFRDPNIDMMALYIEWFNHTLKGLPFKSEIFSDKVYSYVMGEGKWINRNVLHDEKKDTLTYYLGSNHNKPGIYHAGFLKNTPGNEMDYSEINYNPIDTTDINVPLFPEKYAFTNVDADSNLLVFNSEKLISDVIVDGQITADLTISIDAPDADLRCIFYEIRPDGQEFFLTEDFMRVRYRNSLEKATLNKNGELFTYTFKAYYYVCRKLQKGSRIRLVFGPLNSQGVDKNYNAGGNTLTENNQDAKVTKIRLFHNRKHQSTIQIPINNHLKR